MRIDDLDYKKRNILTWNEIAPRYHKRWASKNNGPFQCTQKLVQLVNLRKENKVLDLACGTGVVTKEIHRKIGKSGRIVGIDASLTAIRIAKKWNNLQTNLDFVNMDAENFDFDSYFDIVTCQYALFFFPNAQKALKNIRNSLRSGGTLGIAVHGNKSNVPFFSSILDAVINFIPDYIPQGTPDLDRFGTKKALTEEVRKAGFSKIIVKEFNFKYSPGKFEDYWKNYLRYVAKPLKEKLDSLERLQKRKLKEEIKKNTDPIQGRMEL